MHNEEMQVNMEALGGHCYFCSVAFSYDHEKKKKTHSFTDQSKII